MWRSGGTPRLGLSPLTAHWVLVLLQCGVGSACLLCKTLGSVQPLRRHLTPRQQQARAALGKPGGRDQVVFLEELAQQGRSGVSGCVTRWVMGSIFRPRRPNGERAGLIWGSKISQNPQPPGRPKKLPRELWAGVSEGDGVLCVLVRYRGP